MHIEHAGFWWGNLKGRGHLKFIGIGVRLYLNSTHGTLQF